MQPIISKRRTERSLAWVAAAVILTAAYAVMVGGCCSFSATIIDSSDTKTTVKNPRLENDKFLIVLLGGAVREIPLRDIRMVKIDPTEQVNHDRRQFFAAQVILRDGSVLSDAGNDSGIDRKCYIGVQNVLLGRQHKGLVRIPLANIQQLKVDK